MSALHSRVCEHCGKHYTGNKRYKYCSEPCKWAANNARVRSRPVRKNKSPPKKNSVLRVKVNLEHGVDWSRALRAIARCGTPMVSIATQLGVTAGALDSMKNQNIEPRHDIGEAILSLYDQVVKLPRPYKRNFVNALPETKAVHSMVVQPTA